MTLLAPGAKTTLTFNRKNPERIELILPVTIVEDTVDHTMATIMAGASIHTRLLADGTHAPRDIPYLELAKMDRKLGETTWVNTNVLFIWKPEWHWDVRLYWRADTREFIGWYINIQDRVRRSEEGFETTDHFLDIEVAPDRRWTYKDEAELSDAVALGMYSNIEHTSILSWAEAASQLIENWQWPFASDLRSFESFNN